MVVTMCIRCIIGVAVVLYSLVKASSSRPHRSSPYGVVMKAGPAFSWLKKLNETELGSVNNKCQHGVGVLKANMSAHHHPADRIIGGQLASVGQFPYAAVLGDSHTHIAKCGATLISPRHLLTAAHCVRSDKSGTTGINQTVWLGGVCYYRSPEDNCPVPDMFQGEMELATKVYYSYSARDKRTWDEKIAAEPADLALIQLRAPIDRRVIESGRVDFACLPPPSSTPVPQSLYNIGWGRQSAAEDGGGFYSAHLRFVRLLTQPRGEWSAKMLELAGCQTSRASPRLCQYPPRRAEAAAYRGDSGSGAFARSADNDASANADVLYAVHSTGFKISYSVNKSDWLEPYVSRILGDDVSVQYYLDDLCYYLHLGCGVGGVTGVGTTLRLSSFYLKRKRSEMPAIGPFTPLSKEEPLTQHNTPEQAVAALVDVKSGRKGAVICLAITISPRHLVTSRKCIEDKYLRPRKEQKKGMIGSGRRSILPSLWIASANSTEAAEFIAWQRTIAAATQDQKTASSDLAIIQLAKAKK